jgi:hypothetical protein
MRGVINPAHDFLLTLLFLYQLSTLLLFLVHFYGPTRLTVRPDRCWHRFERCLAMGDLLAVAKDCGEAGR